MSLTDDIIYGLQNIGNEALYSMIELMCELNWDPINIGEHLNLIGGVQTLFKYLYNNENNHLQIHDELYWALKMALHDPAGIDLFEDLLERSNDKTKFNFTEYRFENNYTLAHLLAREVMSISKPQRICLMPLGHKKEVNFCHNSIVRVVLL